MESKAKLFGHPIHQMLIVFPLGLLSTATIFDIVYLVVGGSQWAYVSFYLIAAGVIGGVVAAVFGLIDFLWVPKRTRARRVGAIHGVGNVFVLGMYWMSFYMRIGASETPPIAAIVLSITGVLLATVTGWLGGELVNRLSVGVDDGANVNAPSSLTGPARGRESDRRMAAD